MSNEKRYLRGEREREKRKSQAKKNQSISDPSCSPMRQWTFMIAQRFPRRKKPSTLLTREFTDFAMLGNFMPESIMLSRKLLGTPKRTRERGAWFGFMCFDVYFESILTREPSFATDDQAWETPSVIGLGT